MHPDGFVGDGKLRSDFFVAIAARHQLENLNFPRRQVLFHKMLGDLSGNRTRDDAASRVYAAYRFHQLTIGRRF